MPPHYRLANGRGSGAIPRTCRGTHQSCRTESTCCVVCGEIVAAWRRSAGAGAGSNDVEGVEQCFETVTGSERCAAWFACSIVSQGGAAALGEAVLKAQRACSPVSEAWERSEEKTPRLHEDACGSMLVDRHWRGQGGIACPNGGAQIHYRYCANLPQKSGARGCFVQSGRGEGPASTSRLWEEETEMRSGLVR